MTVTRFQQLGAFVNDWSAISESQLRAFANAGGRWIVPILAQLGYPEGHDPVADHNLAVIDGIIEACEHYNIAVGGWFNGWAGGALNTTAAMDAERVSAIMHGHKFDGPICLDLEAAYQHPGGLPQEMAKLVSEVKKLHPTRGIIVSTNSPNDSIIVNGGQLGYSQSFQRLGVRLAPQWYPWMGQWGDPAASMHWISAHGMEDNWFDPSGPGKRAVPRTYVHGTLEANLEGATLAPQIERLRAAQIYGFSVGFSIYLLETCTKTDFDLLAAERGRLFLV